MIPTKKTAFATKANKCYVKYKHVNNRREQSDLFSLQREADHRLTLHAIYTSNRSRTSVCAGTADTDVFILMLFVAVSQ